MKHLKLFESFKEEDIHKICKKYDIKNYIINSDCSIDVNGNVNFRWKDIYELPLKFRNVTGYFDCGVNYLTSLEGCPESVGGDFFSNSNRLTSLEGGPKSVGGFFSCVNNRLTSLKGCPKLVGRGFSCYNNELTSLEGGPESVGLDFACGSNQLTSLEGCPKSVGGNFDCHYNEIIAFEQLPYSIGGGFLCFGNPINQIWKLFEDYSKIEFLNDCDAIREPNIIILDRLNFFLEEIGKKPVAYVKGYDCI